MSLISLLPSFAPRDGKSQWDFRTCEFHYANHVRPRAVGLRSSEHSRRGRDCPPLGKVQTTSELPFSYSECKFYGQRQESTSHVCVSKLEIVPDRMIVRSISLLVIHNALARVRLTIGYSRRSLFCGYVEVAICSDLPKIMQTNILRLLSQCLTF